MDYRLAYSRALWALAVENWQRKPEYQVAGCGVGVQVRPRGRNRGLWKSKLGLHSWGVMGAGVRY